MQKFEFWLKEDYSGEDGSPFFVEAVRGAQFPNGIFVFDALRLLEDTLEFHSYGRKGRLEDDEAQFLATSGINKPEIAFVVEAGSDAQAKLIEFANVFLKELRAWRSRNPILGPFVLDPSSPLVAIEEASENGTRSLLGHEGVVASAFQFFGAPVTENGPLPVVVRETVKQIAFVDEFIFDDVRMTSRDLNDMLDWLNDIIGESQFLDVFGQAMFDYLVKYRVVQVDPTDLRVVWGPNCQSFMDCIERLWDL